MEANWEDPDYLRARARRKTIWIIGFALHIALFALLIGWPYVRGEMRGRDSRRAFGVFAACFYGGEVTGEAGLSLPAGDRLAYADHYLSADEDWPERCRPLLGQLIDGEPFLLYPGVKGAEALVRQEAELADAELAALARERSASEGEGRIPTEPLEAVGRVAGSLAELAREIDPRTPIEDEVIDLGAVGLPDPARVPLTTASDAVIQIRALGDGIRVRAVDARGLSRTRSLGGRSRAGRIRRPGTVRAMIDGPDEDPILVHATNPNRCPEDPYRCARRSTGLARWVFGEGATEPIWLSGHPRGRIDRSIRVDPHQAWMVAVGADGEGAELRWFSLPEEADSDSETDSETDREADSQTTPAMLAPDRTIVLDGVTAVDDVLLIPGRALYSVTDEDGETRFYGRGAEGEPSLLAELSGGSPYIAACDDAPVVAFGTATAVMIVEEGEAGPVTQHRHDFELGGDAFDARRPSRDRVRLVCDDEGATLAVHHLDGRLEIITCARTGACEGATPVAPAAAGFGLVRSEGRTVVAWTADEAEGAVRVRAFGGDADPTPRIIAACFEGGEGFCGVPRLAEENGRILIVVQEGADLRAVESTDGGATFQRMTGIR